MIGTLVAALLAAGLAAPAAAGEPAQPSVPSVAFTLGARVSIAFPMGSVSSDPTTGPLLIDELVTLSIPLQLDAGVTLFRRWFVGAYLQYGWNVLQVGQCKVGDSCKLTGLRVGLQGLSTNRATPRGWVSAPGTSGCSPSTAAPVTPPRSTWGAGSS
jgi:hypothetical protein